MKWCLTDWKKWKGSYRDIWEGKIQVCEIVKEKTENEGLKQDSLRVIKNILYY